MVSSLWRQISPAHGLLPEPVLEQLALCHWPGNFRELAGCLRTIAALHDPGEPISLAVLPRSMVHAASIVSLPGDLGKLTEAAMRSAVDLHKGNLSAAARALNVDRSTLYRRLVWREPGG